MSTKKYLFHIPIVFLTFVYSFFAFFAPFRS